MQFLRCLAVLAGQLHSEVFVPVVALGLAQELPALRAVPSSYRLKHVSDMRGGQREECDSEQLTLTHASGECGEAQHPCGYLV